MKKIIIGAAIIGLLSSTAYASGNNNNPQPNNGPVYNNGGGGGGGSAIQGQAQGQIQGQAQGQGQLQSLKNTVYGDRTTATGGRGGDAAARGGDQSQGQQTNISNVGNQYSQYPVSGASAPSFAIGQCQWALSGGAQFFGFGASLGGAGMYEFCKPLMKAQHFYQQGKPHVAKNLECNYSEFKEAYRMAGEPCRNDMTKEEIARADAQATAALNAPRAAYSPCPNGVAREIKQRDGSTQLVCR